MATTNFVDQTTVITADWANDVDALVYDIFGEAATDAEARTNLGVAIGSDVQAFDAALDDISGLSLTDGNIIVGDGANWVAESGNTARTSLGLGTGDSPQFTGLTLTGDLTVDTDTFVVDGTNHYNYSDTIQVRGNTTPAGGKGLELYFNSPSDFGSVLAYDRDGSVYKDLRINAATTRILDSGTNTIVTDGSANVSIPNGLLNVSGGGLKVNGNIQIDSPIATFLMSNAAGTPGTVLDIRTGAADQIAIGNVGGTNFGDLEFFGTSTQDLIISSTDGGIYTPNATGNSQGADSINASALYDDGVAVPSSSGTTGGTGSAGAGNQYIELTISGTTYKILHDGTV